jgi:hypothetical protein
MLGAAIVPHCDRMVGPAKPHTPMWTR